MIEVFLFTFGLLIGSFLNVCIYRLPLNQSVVMPPSHCMNCNTRLKPWDLIPVISYLVSRGHCRYCHASFSARYAFVEILTASLFVWCLQIFGCSLALVKPLLLTAFFIVITFIDYDHQLIFDKVLLCLSVVGVVINLWTGNVEILDMLIACLGGGSLFLLLAMISGGMGGGDVKFVAALGLCFGWQSLALIVLLSFIFGGVIGVVLLALKIKSRKDFIPFGPFIALGALLSMLYGNNIITWYLGNL